jgi:Tfp pilus assembly PilM family ATPase
MGKSALRIGLDLEQSSIAAVQIKSSKQSQVLTSAAVRALPEGLVFEVRSSTPTGLPPSSSRSGRRPSSTGAA